MEDLDKAMTSANDAKLDFTIRTDESGDYIHFFDGRDKIRGDKEIMYYMYQRLAAFQSLLERRELESRIDELDRFKKLTFPNTSPFGNQYLFDYANNRLAELSQRGEKKGEL